MHFLFRCLFRFDLLHILHEEVAWAADESMVREDERAWHASAWRAGVADARRRWRALLRHATSHRQTGGVRTQQTAKATENARLLGALAILPPPEQLLEHRV